MYVCICICVFIHIYIYIYTYSYVYIYIYTYTYTISSFMKLSHVLHIYLVFMLEGLENSSDHIARGLTSSQSQCRTQLSGVSLVTKGRAQDMFLLPQVAGVR